MSWWGKVIGGTFGFMLGGPLGALLGASMGHNFDRGLNNMSGSGGGAANVEKIQTAFFTATFSMMGHIAKADGQVSEDELSMARSVMQQMRLDASQKKAAINLFEAGKKADFPAKDILQQFRVECHRRRNLIQMFMEIQIATALADGKLDPAESKILNDASQILGFSKQEYQSVLQRMRAQRHHQSSNSAQMSLSDAYKILGSNKAASDAEVKKCYRRQMNQHHPDKLVSKGLPQEMMDIATQKTQDIKAAYDLIKTSRQH